MVVCANCGLDNEEGSHYCDRCGTELGRTTTPDSHPDEAVEDPTVAGSSSWTQREQKPDDG
jgi:predicted amidophosphoribosyltransferase